MSGGAGTTAADGAPAGARNVLTAGSGTRPNIVVLDDYEGALRTLADWASIDARAEVAVHRTPLRGGALTDAVREADALVLMRDRTPLDAALIGQMPRLRCVVYTGTRNAALDAAALAARGIALCHTGWGPSKEATAELTWTLILAAAKQLDGHVSAMRAGVWRGAGLGAVLSGQRLGIVGLGEIGSRVARIGQAFGMDVVTWSPRMTAERAAAAGVAALPLDELLATSRVVSLHLVPTADTRQLMNAERLARMRRDAILVNTSRAALIDMVALPQALAAGHPGAAAIDVYEREPLAADDPIRHTPGLLMTPHIGFVAEAVFERFALDVTECLSAWLDGAPLPRQLS